MKNVSLKMEEGMERKLAATAKSLQTTKSSVVREALERYFAGSSASPTGSCLDLAGNLVGCIDGPSDLSSNPDYLEGFGE